MFFSAMAVTVAMWLITLGLCKVVFWIAPNSLLPPKVFMLHMCLVLPCSLIAAFVGGITMGNLGLRLRETLTAASSKEPLSTDDRADNQVMQRSCGPPVN